MAINLEKDHDWFAHFGDFLKFKFVSNLCDSNFRRDRFGGNGLFLVEDCARATFFLDW